MTTHQQMAPTTTTTTTTMDPKKAPKTKKAPRRELSGGFATAAAAQHIQIQSRNHLELEQRWASTSTIFDTKVCTAAALRLNLREDMMAECSLISIRQEHA